jgi:alpha-L-rhamnosidase
MRFIPATRERVKIKPELICDYGAPVKAHELFKPISVTEKDGKLIYDFGQNFAGVVRFTVNGKQGQKIVIKHAEILTSDGDLNTAFLRSAKCEITYICKDGKQTYMPCATYMGFRYVSVTGVNKDDIEIEGVALYSAIGQNGSFTCSNENINQLQSNIVWSGKSNFVDIPTDCPQRDERMGWTGDIAVFASTACFNFDMRRFLDKWLKDVRAEQTRGGGIPNTVPVQGYGFPATMPKKAIAFWGDACVFVPWASYLAYGDESVLKENYQTMKRYVKACTFWAKLFSVGKNKYIWNDIPAMQFGDWVAPDVEKMSAWQARCKWTGTASIARSAELLSKIARILGEDKDAEYYQTLRDKTADAYVSILTDGNGKLKEEFQTAYVLPLHFEMFPAEQRKNAVDNLVRLLEENSYAIGTGFPGTPYLLFALADNGRADVAFKTLFNDKCPSWLYEVKTGATTVWERWDALDENGACAMGDDGTGGMVSFNHYAFGAVGDFFYRRIAGIEAIDGGYKRFRVQPLTNELTYASASVQSPYGEIQSSWEKKDGKFTLRVKVPVSTTCKVVMPSGKTYEVENGVYEFKE